VGGAELSDRDPKFIIANPGAASRDIRRLIDLVRGKVEERTSVALELQIDLW
jgi:UDP-N-acetylenolpyruvoylglucosamine reductase